MTHRYPYFQRYLGILLAGILFAFLGATKDRHRKKVTFPYAEAGLSSEQAAAHLLSRFTFGPKPGQVKQVIASGLENWFIEQLDGQLPDDSLSDLLGQYDALDLSNAEIVETYMQPGKLKRMAIEKGYIDLDSVDADDSQNYRKAIQRLLKDESLSTQQELFRQLINQKILRATYSENQLREVMTTFWFNHFNVSLTKNVCAPFVPNYERDVIRPMALGKFGDLLLATAKSPAMLCYLDNFNSASALPPKGGMNKAPKRPRSRGVNENYAREVMELHTLGVDGGYSQKDVSEAARVLTGWTVFPQDPDNPLRKRLETMGTAQTRKQGYVVDGDFLFAVDRHDKGKKTVLGKQFGSNGGFEEGVELLEMLAHHRSTAQFICKKLAVRFVCDTPSKPLVDRMADVFLARDGDIREVLLAMVESPEFWDADAVREKIKSPFEVAISAVRSLDARVAQPYQLFTWINKMGERFYYYNAPTGFPDYGQYWINTASLLSRMNFGMAMASGRIKGVSVDLAALNDRREPESAVHALAMYSELLLPGKPIEPTLDRLQPQLRDPKDNSPVLVQVVGLIIGSPEFQRR